MTTALLVIDCQHFFRPMLGGALPQILRLAKAFQFCQFPVIATQHGHSEAELTPPYKNQLVRKWGPDGSIAKGSEDWELIPEIAKVVKESGSPVVAKNTYDAFLGTEYPLLGQGKPWEKPPASELEGLLREKGIERVVVTGVMTDCCCDTTARSAFHRGFETWLVRDACGSANKKQHEAGLRAFGFAFGDVVDTDDVIKAVGG